MPTRQRGRAPAGQPARGNRRPTDDTDEPGRRSVVPPAAGRSLWLAALWTGAGTAVVCGAIAIAAVAICWLPASGTSGSAGSAIRAGMITFLAGVHAGVTVDGLSAAFLPLGIALLIGLVARRAGAGLADVAADLGERRRGTLLQASALQAVAFGLVCGIAAHFATLGSSSVPAVAAAVAAIVLFALFGGTAFVGASALGAQLDAWLPDHVKRAARLAAAGVATYLAGGALLVAGSLLVHHGEVEVLVSRLGAGWSGVPVLLLGLLAAPNAAIAGAAYLIGPGFALGTGNHVSPFAAAHGTLPAFPLLGAVPSGRGAGWPGWLLVAVTAVAAAAVVTRVVRGAGGWSDRLRVLGLGSGFAALAGVLLGWQGGGAIGSDRLNAIGASPWQLGLAFGVALGLLCAAGLGVVALVESMRGRDEDEMPAVVRAAVGAVTTVTSAVNAIVEADQAPVRSSARSEGTEKNDKLAG